MINNLPVARIAFIACFAISWSTYAQAEFLQDHPELCGAAPDARILVPKGLAIRSGLDDPTARVTFDGVSGEVTIDDGASDIQQICPISENRIVLFGTGSAPPLYSVSIIDLLNLKLLDSFYSYSPILSPDQRWIMRRKFYPLRVETTQTEEYLLYDMQKDFRGKRVDNIRAAGLEGVGRPVYPLGLSQTVYATQGMKENQQHEFHSDSLTWSPDSTAVAFADSVGHKLSVVVVTIDRNGKTQPFLHSVQGPEKCSGNSALYEVAFAKWTGKLAGSTFQLTMHGNACKQREFSISGDDFVPAKPEVFTYDQVPAPAEN